MANSLRRKIDWNNDSDRVYVESSFTYYRKGNSLFVKGDFEKEFYEQQIRELTDSTLTLEIPKAGLVFTIQHKPGKTVLHKVR